MASIQDMLSDLRHWGIDMSGVRRTPELRAELVKLILGHFAGAKAMEGGEWSANDRAAQLSQRRDEERREEDRFRREDDARADEIVKGFDAALGRHRNRSA